MPAALQVDKSHDGNEAADVEAAGGRVETDIGRYGLPAITEELLQRSLIRCLFYETPLTQGIEKTAQAHRLLLWAAALPGSAGCGKRNKLSEKTVDLLLVD